MKYYVYILAYPMGFIDEYGNDLSNNVFYVGKGTKQRPGTLQRIDMHERSVISGPLSNQEKIQVIQKIQARGMQVHKEVIAEFEKEQDALIYEWGMIVLHYKTIVNMRLGGAWLVAGPRSRRKRSRQNQTVKAEPRQRRKVQQDKVKFTVPETTMAQVADIIEWTGMTQSQLVMMAIDHMHHKYK